MLVVRSARVQRANICANIRHRRLTSSKMSLINYDNAISTTASGDINSIPDEIIMEWCRYLNNRNRVKFARTCKRIARLEREAGERIVDYLRLSIYESIIWLNSMEDWKPEQTPKWLNRARVRDFTLMISDTNNMEYSSRFIHTLNSIRYQRLTATLSVGDDKKHNNLLSALLHNRDIGDAELTIKWNCDLEEHNIRIVKEWLLKMPKTKSLKIEWVEFSLNFYEYYSFDDDLLYHLARNTSYLYLSLLPCSITIEGMTRIWELFRDTDLRRVRLSTSIEYAKQLRILYSNYDNPRFIFNFSQHCFFDKADILMISTIQI